MIVLLVLNPVCVFAVIVAVPFATAVTLPELETLATFGFDDDHLILYVFNIDAVVVRENMDV